MVDILGALKMIMRIIFGASNADFIMKMLRMCEKF